MSLILASASPRRRELLSEAGFSFKIIPSSADESIENGMDAETAVFTLAERKAKSVFAQHHNSVVIGSDTVVVLEGRILGKPSSEAEAGEMLRALSGREHTVMTGVYIASEGFNCGFTEKVYVKFFDLTEDEIESYVKTGECNDKAGSYGIQGKGKMFVERINGDYNAVVGLPIARLSRVLSGKIKL